MLLNHAFGDFDGPAIVVMPRRDGKLHDGEERGDLHPSRVQLFRQVTVRVVESRGEGMPR